MARSLLALSLLAFLTACDTAEDTGVEVVRHTGPEIIEADAVVEDARGTHEWSGSVGYFRGGTSVLLGQSSPCGDGCFQNLSLFFDDQGEGRLPAFNKMVRSLQTATPEDREVPVARVEVQDWGPEVYSGRVIPAETNTDDVRSPIVFWADELGHIAE